MVIGLLHKSLKDRIRELVIYKKCQPEDIKEFRECVEEFAKLKSPAEKVAHQDNFRRYFKAFGGHILEDLGRREYSIIHSILYPGFPVRFPTTRGVAVKPDSFFSEIEKYAGNNTSSIISQIRAVIAEEKFLECGKMAEKIKEGLRQRIKLFLSRINDKGVLEYLDSKNDLLVDAICKLWDEIVIIKKNKQNPQNIQRASASRNIARFIRVLSGMVKVEIDLRKGSIKAAA